MITGDNEVTAQHIADNLKIDRVFANTMPNDKMSIIEQLKIEYGSIAFIGDGINDAPALAHANVSIAMGAGSEIAIDTADIILMHNDLSEIRSAVEFAKKLNLVIKQNFIFASIIIGLMIFFNIILTVELPVAILLHEGSTIVVILNGLRLLK